MAMYKDAKDWFEQNASEGGISLDTLISCILCNLDNDDIERWFGVSMEREEDNPGAEDVECPECNEMFSGEDEIESISEHGMCVSCWNDDRTEDEGEDDEDPDGVWGRVAYPGVPSSIWLDNEDFDYTRDPEGDPNVYPFPSSETL